MLTCPKCGGTMREVKRSGVAVDRCAECGGIFLDAGELESLSASEQRYYYDDDDDDDRRFQRGYRDDDRDDRNRRPYKKKKKRSFFEDLLDFD